MGSSRGLERLRTAAVSGWKTARVMGLRGLAVVFDGLSRSMRGGAQRLERAAAAARTRANPLPAADPPALAPVAAPVIDETIVAPAAPVVSDKTIVAPAATVVSDKTIVARPAFLERPTPALPPPRPGWGSGPVLPPPRRAEWRAAMEKKAQAGEGGEAPPEPAAQPRSDG